MESNMILMVGGMLFTVFSPPLMAIGLGASLKEGQIARQGLKAFFAANLITIMGAAGLAFCLRRPLRWDDFGSLWGNLFISITAAVVGATADADDAGRRQLIAIAAAFPYSRFPPWIGMCLVQGFPAAHVTFERLGIFAGNIAAMIISAGIVYRCIGASSRNFFKSRTK
jgi:hypothetical protein